MSDEIELTDQQVAVIREWALNLTHCPICEKYGNKKIPVMWIFGKLECHECGFKMLDTQTPKTEPSGAM